MITMPQSSCCFFTVSEIICLSNLNDVIAEVIDSHISNSGTLSSGIHDDTFTMYDSHGFFPPAL